MLDEKSVLFVFGSTVPELHMEEQGELSVLTVTQHEGSVKDMLGREL